MKKYICFWFILLDIVIFILMFTNDSNAKDNSSSIVTLDEQGNVVPATDTPSENSINIFSTRSEQEYLQFLTDNDDKFDFIDISAIMDTYNYGDSYIITYTSKKDLNTNQSTSYSYYLYKTRDKSEYLNFYNSFDFNTYEIIDISTALQTYNREESYVITYRKQN